MSAAKSAALAAARQAVTDAWNTASPNTDDLNFWDLSAARQEATARAYQALALVTADVIYRSALEDAAMYRFAEANRCRAHAEDEAAERAREGVAG